MAPVNSNVRTSSLSLLRNSAVLAELSPAGSDKAILQIARRTPLLQPVWTHSKAEGYTFEMMGDDLYEQTPSDIVDRLLHPLTRGEFINQIWQKRTIRVEGAADKFDWLIDHQTVLSLLDAPDIEALVVEDDGSGVRDRRALNGRSPRELYEQGLDIHIMDFHQREEAWTKAVAELRGELGHPGRVTLLAICTQSHEPVDYHFDGRGVINIQLLGKKRWRAAPEVAVSWPHLYAHEKSNEKVLAKLDPEWQTEIFSKRPADEDTLVFTMTPGDVTYVPSGLWHSVPEIVETPSVSVLLTFDPMPTAELLFTKLNRDLLRQESQRSAPLHGWNDPGYLEQTYETLRTWADNLSESAIRDALIMRMTEGTVPLFDPSEDLSELAKTATDFQHAYAGPMYLSWENDSKTACALHHGPHQIEFEEPELVPFAQGIMRNQRFTVGQALSWVDQEHAETVRQNLTALAASGFLLPCEP